MKYSIQDYAVAPSAWPAACCELSKIVAYVRSIADENYIDKDKVFAAFLQGDTSPQA